VLTAQDCVLGRAAAVSKSKQHFYNCCYRLKNKDTGFVFTGVLEKSWGYLLECSKIVYHDCDRVGGLFSARMIYLNSAKQNEFMIIRVGLGVLVVLGLLNVVLT
jgi:hypothetical protein